MTSFVVAPDRHRQFGEGGERFRVVVPAGRIGDFVLAPSERYRDSDVVGLADDEPLEAAFLDGRCPPGSDVLVVCPGQFVVSPSEAAIGDRRLSVMPCGSTPVTDEQVGHFLAVTEASDPAALSGACERLFAAFERSPEVTLTDEAHGATATFRPSADYEWNQQAGVLEPGEQQIAPAGEASAVPAGIFDFDTSRRLAVDGTIAARGSVIVHRGEKTSTDDQARLFADLAVITDAAVLLDIEGGAVVAVRPYDAAGERAARAMAALYERDGDYRILWEFGVGLNPHIEPQPGNCGMNEMYGSSNGVLHLGFGLTPSTAFALTFVCADTVLTGPDGEVICGGAQALPQSRKRLNIRRSASCGCQ